MSKRYVRSKYRKNFDTGYRRRRAGKLKLACFIAVIFLFSIITIGFVRKESPIDNKMSGIKQKTRMTDNDFQDYTSHDYNTDKEDLKNSDSETPWYLTLVNKQNPIPEAYEPKLVELQGGEYVDERIYKPLMEMLEASREANWNQLPDVVSGYRTAEIQQSLYDEKISEYEKEGYSEKEAKKFAEQWVAVPGYSEHQLGFAVDINGASYDLYLWLQENSYKYGFIFRYPGNKTDITGVKEEVWHYRYVGPETAAKMYEQGLCLEEYVQKNL